MVEDNAKIRLSCVHWLAISDHGAAGRHDVSIPISRSAVQFDIQLNEANSDSLNFESTTSHHTPLLILTSPLILDSSTEAPFSPSLHNSIDTHYRSISITQVIKDISRSYISTSSVRFLFIVQLDVRSTLGLTLFDLGARLLASLQFLRFLALQDSYRAVAVTCPGLTLPVAHSLSRSGLFGS